jgi:hypothetical protein
MIHVGQKSPIFPGDNEHASGVIYCNQENSLQMLFMPISFYSVQILAMFANIVDKDEFTCSRQTPWLTCHVWSWEKKYSKIQDL